MDHDTLIDAAGLRALIGRAVIFDCRFDLTSPAAGRKAYLREHIPTARYLDLERDLSSPATAGSGRHPLPQRAAFAQRLGELGVRADSQVVVYDELNGSFAARAWWLMRWVGHSRVAVLDGGMRAWLAAGGPTESGGGSASETGSPPSSAAPALPPDSGQVVSSGELLHALSDGRSLLVDARAPERYAGTVEPIDPVAGHVPGAVNHPFGSNLGEDGRFLPPEELRRRWVGRLAGTPPSAVIAMCGSGVTACHNLLAMHIAGLPGARLYAGSWSEWIRDPDRPVARGDEPSRR